MMAVLKVCVVWVIVVGRCGQLQQDVARAKEQSAKFERAWVVSQ